MNRAAAILGFFAFVPGLLPAQPPDKQPPVELRWKLVAGQSFYQEISTETHQKMKVQGLEVVQTQRQTCWIKWTPTKETDKTWTIEQEILGVKIEVAVGRNNPPGGPLNPFQKALVGARFTLTITKADMNVEKIDGREAFVQKLIQADERLKPLLEAVLSEDAVKQLAEPIFGFVPVGGIVPNDKKWTRKTVVNMGPIGSYETDSIYSYVGPNQKKLHEIHHHAKMAYRRAPKDNEAGMGFKIVQADLKTTGGTGTIVFDREQGRVDRSELKLALEGSLTIEIGGMNTQVELWQTQKTTARVTAKNPLK